MDKRFIQESGIQAYTGTELLFKGALEGGASLLTGYPGSPVADFFNIAKQADEVLKEKGVLLQIANNEALGVARLNGSQMSDIRGLCVMKSVGLHVASDGLALGNISKAGSKGGALVVVGDDPWSESTQVPTDSRFLSQHLHMPIMEPATFQELKDWIRIGFEASQCSNLYITYLVTTNLADGGATVEVSPNQYPEINAHNHVTLDTEKIPVEETVVLSPRTAEREETLQGRYEVLHQYVRKQQLDKIINPAKEGSVERIGFVTSGLAYGYLEHALELLGLRGQIPILKYGLTYPIDSEILLNFSNQVDHIVVVEEKRSFIETQITEILKVAEQKGKISRRNSVWGKNFPGGITPIPSTRGLNTSVLIEILVPLLKHMELKQEKEVISYWEREINLIEKTSQFDIQIPTRTPAFCPGCPHRDSSSVFLDMKTNFMNVEYMEKNHGVKGSVDLVFHGDTGCYTMLMFKPNKSLMHNYSGMGLGIATGAGIDPFIDNKQIVFMGDGTFFHSGMIAISDAMKHGQDIMVMILDNDTTAMTGHQPTPGQNYDILGESTFKQNIEEVVKGMAKNSEIPVYRVNPEYRDSYRDLLEKTVLEKGVKIVIADKECGITYNRQVIRDEQTVIRDKGFLPEKTFVNVTPEVCENCLECTTTTGCPGLTVEKTHYGPKIATDLSLCVSDGACARVKACPSFEELTVVRNKKPVDPMDDVDLSNLPLPNLNKFDDSWSAYLAGVGGMGIGLVTAILVQAGLKQGYRVDFADKKGLAIRNGGVYSHVTFTQKDHLNIISPIIPYGKANLVLGLDLLESVRSFDPKLNLRVGSPDYTAAVVNTAKTPTITMLLGEDDFDPSDLEEMICASSKRERFFGVNVSDIAQKLLGNTIFSNIVMLGIAYQKGELPINLENIEWAIKATATKRGFEKNLRAFNLGRKVAENPAQFEKEKSLATYKEMIDDKFEILSQKNSNKKIAEEYKRNVEEVVKFLKLDDETNLQIALRTYDLIQFEDLAYAQKYLDRIKSIYLRDKDEQGYLVTKAVILYLAKVMLIKDEIYVAHLLTSVEKYRRDKERYGIDLNRGDKVKYTHINRPQFTIGSWDIEFDMKTKDWMLNIMKHLRILRKLLPAWHRKEKQFRDWYIDLVDELTLNGKTSYQDYVTIFESPEYVRGYRKVRYPKMDEAKKKVTHILSKANAASQVDPQPISKAS